MSPLGDRSDHSCLMIKHVDAHDNDTGHSVLLLKEGGQGELGCEDAKMEGAAEARLMGRG